MGLLLAIARTVLGRAAVTGAAPAAAGIARRVAIPTALGFGGAAAFDIFGGGDTVTRRRRRKRVLTANDRADISFITATLGAPAGKAFAMIVAARA